MTGLGTPNYAKLAVAAMKPVAPTPAPVPTPGPAPTPPAPGPGPASHYKCQVLAKKCVPGDGVFKTLAGCQSRCN